jgi:homoserine kinase type II
MAYEHNLPFDVGELNGWLEGVYDLVVEHLDVRPGYMSTVVFVDTSSGRFVLKSVKNNTGVEARLKAQIALVGHLKLKKMLVADCVVGRDQKRVFIVGKYSMSMWTFLVGDVFTSGNQRQIVATGTMLGKMHRVVSGWETAPSNMRSLGWPERVSQLKSEWRVLIDSGAQGKALVDCLHGHLAQWDAPIEDGPRIVVHNDFRAQNLLFQGDTVSGILDLDEVCLGFRIFDVAYSLAFFQAVVADRPLNESEMLAFLQGYHQIFPFDTPELSNLSCWLGLALLKGLTLWGRICYVDQVNFQTQAWIDTYLPLLERVDDIGSHLQSGLTG